MKARIEDGEPIRQMDPLFREIFEHHAAIEMEIDEVRGGMRVVETSADSRHAAVDGPTQLPPGYRG